MLLQNEEVHLDTKRFFLESRFLPSTEISYGRFLRFVSDWLELEGLTLEELTPEQCRRFLDSRNWIGSTEYHCTCAVRALMRHHLGEDHPLKNFKIRRIDPGPQRTLSTREVQELVGSLDTNRKADKRNLPLVLLMLDSGLRSNEVVGLLTEHISLGDKRLHVLGKSAKWRTAIFSDMTRAALGRWLQIRQGIALPKTDTLFCSMGGGRPGTPLTRDGLRAIFRAMGSRAGIHGLSPHVLRRTFATLAIRQGASSRLVQVAGGWSSLLMVQRYTQDIGPEDFNAYFATNVLQHAGQ